MSCETLSDKLTGYLDRELDERAAGEVEAHLRQCVPAPRASSESGESVPLCRPS